MGIQCRIIRDSNGNVDYVEAPNGERSQLYEDAKRLVGEEAALSTVLTAYTPTFIEEVKNPKIDAFRQELVNRINSIPTNTNNITVNLEGIDYSMNPNSIEMAVEDLGNVEMLINFTAAYNPVTVEIEPTAPTPQISFDITEETETEINRIKEAPNTEETGVTLNIDGTVYDTGGLVVPLGSINVTQETLTSESLQEFIRENQSKIANTDVFKVGLYKFENSDQVSIDLNIVVNPQYRDAAIEFGKQSGQESLFDLDTFENVKTGADGTNPIEYTDSEIRTIGESLTRGEVPNLNEIENRTGATQSFFSDVVKGKSEKFKAKKTWEPIIPFKPTETNFKETYDKHQGNFDTHIATSIPTFRETQIKVGTVLSEMYGEEQNPLIYDIGGSEGGFVKAITEETEGNIKTINLDVNPDMKDAHNRTPVKGSKFVLEAFYEGYTDSDAGITFKRHVPTQKADVVHESMVFQFISPERGPFIREVREYYLKEDGIALFEEKLSTYDENVWLENERKKDEYKRQYYSKAEMTQKSEEVLTGMRENQTYREEFEATLRANFEFVEQYWDAGNFKGYLATNSRARRDEFMDKLGGRIQSQYSENITATRAAIGMIHAAQREEGTQIMLSNIDTQLQGQGLGTEMYKRVASALAEDGEALISDFNSLGAEGIWNKFREAGLAETTTLDGQAVNKTVTTPNTLDSNGEPLVEDVIKYIQSKNFEGQELSEAEISEVKNMMIGTEFGNSSELFTALQRGFMPNGVYNPSETSLVSSGLYTRAEARRLLDNEETQITAYEFIQKLKNTESVDNTLEIDSSYITLDTETNSIGLRNKVNPYLNRQRAIELLGGIKDENIFANQVEAYGLNFARDKFEEFSSMTKVNEVTLDENNLRQKDSFDTLRETMEETLTSPSNIALLENVEYLIDVPLDIWNVEFSNIRTLLEEVEGNAIDIGLDLEGLGEMAYDKTPAEVKEMLRAIRNFTVAQNEVTFDFLIDQYIEYFELESMPNIKTVGVSQEVTNKTLVNLDTTQDSYTLFAEQGLLPLGNNLYQRVNNNATLEEVTDIVYRNLLVNPSLLPVRAFKGGLSSKGTLEQSYITNEANEVYVKQDIENYTNIRSKEIEHSGEVDTDMLKKMVLFSDFFNTNLNNTANVPSYSQEASLIEEFPKNADYLTTEFIADFNKQSLKEKAKNSRKYNEYYSNFTVTPKGIELINKDPITIETMRPHLTEDLVNHFRLKKEGFDFNPEDRLTTELSNIPIVMRNYYKNFPKALPKFEGRYQMDNGTLITNVTPDFLRTNEGVFEYLETVGNKSLFGRLEVNEGNFKQYDNALEPPELREVTKYNLKSGITAAKSINNLYTKKQDEQITNEIDNC